MIEAFNALRLAASTPGAWAGALGNVAQFAAQMLGYYTLGAALPPVPPLAASRETLIKRTRYHGRKGRRALRRLGGRRARVDHLQTGAPCRFCGMKTVPPKEGYIICPAEQCLRETSGRLRGFCAPVTMNEPSVVSVGADISEDL